LYLPKLRISDPFEYRRCVRIAVYARRKQARRTGQAVLATMMETVVLFIPESERSKRSCDEM
jgi:hypothetical protein